MWGGPPARDVAAPGLRTHLVCRAGWQPARRLPAAARTKSGVLAAGEQGRLPAGRRLPACPTWALYTVMVYRLFLLLLLAPAYFAQSPAELLNDQSVRAAMEAAQRNEPQILELQARLCEIPAPPFMEEVRGRELARLFRELGLKDVRTDKAGNVIGVRP